MVINAFFFFQIASETPLDVVSWFAIFFTMNVLIFFNV